MKVARLLTLSLLVLLLFGCTRSESGTDGPSRKEEPSTLAAGEAADEAASSGPAKKDTANIGARSDDTARDDATRDGDRSPAPSKVDRREPASADLPGRRSEAPAAFGGSGSRPGTSERPQAGGAGQGSSGASGRTGESIGESIGGTPPTAESFNIPVELLAGFPAAPRWAADWRIGGLPGEDSVDPQSAFILSATREYAGELLSGGAEDDSYYDRYTEAEVEGRLRANCDSLRLGVPERLSQGEWAVPYRCLQAGEPMRLGGFFYLATDENPRVVDGVAEPLGGANFEAGPFRETEEPPF